MELGKLTAVFDADTRKFDSGMRGVATKVNVLKGEFGALTGGVGSASGALASFTSPLALAAGGAVVAASAIGGLAAGLFSLVRSSAEAGGELFDLSQKTGFTVESLSGLSIVAKTTGTDIQALSGSLIIFQKNMEAAGDVNSRQSRLFQSLNIDIHDNEKALRQVFTALGKMGEGAHQTALATQFFGRSGAAVLAIIKETNGNLDEAIKKYDKMGLIISSSAAQASDKFNDVLEETTLQLSAVTRSIGTELLPVATEALQSISFWLQENKGQWSAWGTTISDVIRGVKAVADSEIGAIIAQIARLGAEISGVPGIVRGLAGLGAADRPSEDFFGPGGAARGGRKALPGTPEWLAAQRRLAGLQGSTITPSGEGGRGGGVKAQRDELEAYKRIVESTSQSLQFYGQTTEHARVEQEFLRAGIEKLNPRFRAQAEALKNIALASADSIDAKNELTEAEAKQRAESERLAQVEASVTEEIFRQTQALSDVISGYPQWLREVDNFIAAKAKEGFLWGQETIEILRNTAARREQIRVLEEQATRLRTVLPTASTGNETRPRIATDAERQQREVEIINERRQRMEEEMRELGSELTNIFSDSIHVGFDRGVKAGLANLAQGLLQIVEDIFLRRLAEGLSDVLIGIAGGRGGILGGIFGGRTPTVAGATRPRTVTPRDVTNQTQSINSATTQQTQALSNQIQLTGQAIVQGLTPVQQGFWKGLLNATLQGALSGLASGVMSGLGEDWSDEGPTGSRPTTPPVLHPQRRAMGGPVYAGLPYDVHRDETIVPMQNGMVYNKQQQQQMGGQTIINISLPPLPPGSYKAPASQRQLANQVLAALQGAKR
jgi:hypothetical protein